MHRYGSYELVNKLSLKELSKLINKAKEEEVREEDYRLYLAVRPHMTKENYVSFDEFRGRTVASVKYDTRPKDEIMEELLELEKQFKER